MGISRQRLLPFLLALLAATAWWLGRVSDNLQEGEDRSQGQPDHTIEGLRVTMLDEKGRPQRRLVAKEARHYPDGAGSELDEPHLTLFPEAGPPWLLRSERGWVAEKAEEVRLQGKVYLDREAGRDNPPLQVETQEVFVWPNEDHARTDQPLYATHGADWLNSPRGGEAWFGESLRARLFGRVSLEYSLKPAPLAKQDPPPHPNLDMNPKWNMTPDPADQVTEENP